MTKWVALALGALLALVGAVSVGLGFDVIQTERGGVLVIAGAVAFTGGVLTFALFAVVGELRALLAVRSAEGPVAREAPVPDHVPEPALGEAVAPPFSLPQVQLVSAPTPAAVPVQAPVKVAEPAPSAPVFHEPPVAEQAGSATPEKPAPAAQKPWERPSPFRSSSFGAARSAALPALAPGAEVVGAASVAEVASAPQKPEAEPVAETPVVEAVEVPEPAANVEPASAEVDVQVERAIAQALANESPAENHEEQLPEPPRQPRSLRQALGLEELPPEETPPKDEKPALEEPKPAPAPLIEVEANPSVAAGYAWLERALATEDGRKSRALEWLRARQRSGTMTETPATDVTKPQPEPEAAPEPLSEAAAEAPSQSASAAPTVMEPEEKPAPEADAALKPVSEQAPAAKADEEPSAEPATAGEPEGAVLSSHVEPEHAAADASGEPEEKGPEPDAAPVHEEAPAPAPSIVGRYSSGGSDFTLYSDGSIDAQTDQGIFHFASMVELRAYIEAQKQQA